MSHTPFDPPGDGRAIIYCHNGGEVVCRTFWFRRMADALADFRQEVIAGQLVLVDQRLKRMTRWVRLASVLLRRAPEQSPISPVLAAINEWLREAGYDRVWGTQLRTVQYQ